MCMSTQTKCSFSTDNLIKKLKSATPCLVRRAVILCFDEMRISAFNAPISMHTFLFIKMDTSFIGKIEKRIAAPVFAGLQLTDNQQINDNFQDSIFVLHFGSLVVGSTAKSYFVLFILSFVSQLICYYILAAT